VGRGGGVGEVGQVLAADLVEFDGEGIDALAAREVEGEAEAVGARERGECGSECDHEEEHNPAAAGCKGVFGRDAIVMKCCGQRGFEWVGA
jgi:hypothetical protein